MMCREEGIWPHDLPVGDSGGKYAEMRVSTSMCEPVICLSHMRPVSGEQRKDTFAWVPPDSHKTDEVQVPPAAL